MPTYRDWKWDLDEDNEIREELEDIEFETKVLTWIDEDKQVEDQED